MREYRFRLVNVFAETQLGGNPLCVFEDGRGISDAEMQALALQMNKLRRIRNSARTQLASDAA